MPEKRKRVKRSKSTEKSPRRIRMEADEADEADEPVSEDNPGGLHAAGFKRVEQLKKRKDALEREIEELSEEMGVEAIDPAKIKPEPEVLYQYGRDPNTGVMTIPIQNRDPSRVYCWVQFMYPSVGSGRFIVAKQLLGYRLVNSAITYRGKPVGSNLPIGPDGSRRVGDLILMDIDRELYEKHQAEDFAKSEKKGQRVTDNFKELGERNGVPVRIEERVIAKDIQLASNVPGGTAASAYHGAQLATSEFNEQLRDGNVRGMEIRKN